MSKKKKCKNWGQFCQVTVTSNPFIQIKIRLSKLDFI